MSVICGTPLCTKTVIITALSSCFTTFIVITYFLDSKLGCARTQFAQLPLSQKPSAMQSLSDMNINSTQTDRVIHSDNTDHEPDLENTDSDTELSNEASKSSPRRDLIERLTQSLQTKLDKFETSDDLLKVKFGSCQSRDIDYNDTVCTPEDGCLRTDIPEDLTQRLDNLLLKEEHPIPRIYRKLLHKMRSKVNNSEVIIVTATSSDHLGEIQALLKNLHTQVFPVLTNFTLIVYDFDLDEFDRWQLEDHCKCTVISFPCKQLPAYFCNPLKSFAWKIFMIAAHLPQAEVLYWTDGSIRIFNQTGIPAILKRTKERGIQLMSKNGMELVPRHTLPQMPEYFGDSPCVYLDFPMVEGGFGFYHREALVYHAILNPLLDCVFNPACLVPVNQLLVQKCKRHVRHNTIGWCHRVDQSAMSIVMAKLFRQKYRHFAVDTRPWMTVKRGDTADYFAQLEKAENTKSLK